MWNTLILEKQDNGVAILKINRPKALNALNAEVMTELVACLGQIAEDSSIAVLVITGEGDRSFVAGADIAYMLPLDAVQGAAWGRMGQKVFTMVENLPQPVIAAVNGFALGGGNELAIACDMRLACEKAKFGQPEHGLGVTPGFGGTQRLPRVIGSGRARYLVYSGEIIDAAKAYEWGLVDMVFPVEGFMDNVLKIAGQIAKHDQFCVRQSKRCMLNGIEAPIDAALELEAQAFGLCFATEAQTDGMTNFLNKGKK